ncbi:MAG: LamG-like jellyroll fold domain-containing protein [Phycisphaerae bacterium]
MSCYRNLLIVWLVAALPPVAAAAQVIHLRSGDGPVNGSDLNITYVAAPQCGTRLSPGAFTSFDFDDARNGLHAFIPAAQNFLPLAGCTGQPATPRQIVVNGTPDRSALYAVPFFVDCPGASDMQFCWRVDDSLGDYNPFLPNPEGLYISNAKFPNGTPISGSGGGNYIETCRNYDTTALLAPGQNWLYIYVRDGGCVFSGLVFCATITIQNPTSAWLSGVAFRDDDCDGVKDLTELPLTGASVMFTNNATGQQFTATSNNSGKFLISGIPFGTYSIIQLPVAGFKTPCTAPVLVVSECVSDLLLPYCPCPDEPLFKSMDSNNDCWQVVATPPGVPGTLPRPVDFVPAHPLWGPNTGWMSATPTGQQGAPIGDYVYECCFCLDERFSNPMLDLCFWADDGSTAYLNGVQIGFGIGAPAAACVPIPTVTDEDLFRPGLNCVQIVVNNGFGPTGLNVTGQMTATAGLCCQQCPCVTPPPNMSAWWMLDETGGLTAFDSSQGQNAGTHTNGPSLAVGQVHAARSYDGVNDYTQVPDHPSLDAGTLPFSIDAWVRASDTDGSIVSKVWLGAAFIDYRGYSLSLQAGLLKLDVADSLFSNATFTHAGPQINDGYWHHVAATVRQNDPFGVKLYVDGVPQTFACALVGNLDNPAPLRIGASNASPLLAGDLLAGQIDEVEFFRRLLTPSEVYGLWRAGSSGKCRLQGGHCPEDLNGNGAIDLSDLSILLSNFGLIGGTGQDGDINGDQVVNLTDLSLLLAAFGATCP